MNNDKSAHLMVHIQGAAHREGIMKGITTAIRLGLTADHVRTNDMENLVPLLELLEDLMPDERELER